MIAFCCSILYLFSLTNLDSSSEGSKEYPRRDLIASANEVESMVKEKGYRLLDCRSKKEYDSGHIPGAISVSVTSWRKTFDPKPQPEALEDQLNKLGLSPTDKLIIYGEELPVTAMGWWILKYAGVADVRILNGGWQSWKGIGKTPESQSNVLKPAKAKWTIAVDRLATKDQLMALVKEGKTCVVDARTPGEFQGTRKITKRSGHIPKAVHLEWTAFIDSKTRQFKTASQLKEIFQQSQVLQQNEHVTYCQAGGRAAVDAFVLELMGAKKVRNYLLSWKEWGNDPTTPIDTPKK